MKTLKRRRKEGKTDYKMRMVLLKSKLPRIIFRKSNKYIIGQYVISKEAQDFVLIGVNSKMLLGLGWKSEGKLKSKEASYLTGYLLGRKIIDKEGKIKAIFDIGLNRNVPKSREYAFVKGVKEAGVDVPCSEKMMPEIKKEIIELIKKEIEKQ